MEGKGMTAPASAQCCVMQRASILVASRQSRLRSLSMSALCYSLPSSRQTLSVGLCMMSRGRPMVLDLLATALKPSRKALPVHTGKFFLLTWGSASMALTTCSRGRVLSVVARGGCHLDMGACPETLTACSHGRRLAMVVQRGGPERMLAVPCTRRSLAQFRGGTPLPPSICDQQGGCRQEIYVSTTCSSQPGLLQRC